MALLIAQPDQDPSSVLVRELSAARANSLETSLALRPTQGEGCRIIGAIPVFTVDFEDAKRKDFLSRARFSSWLYLVCSKGTETKALASVELREINGELDLLHVGVGDSSAVSILAAYRSAEDRLLLVPEEFEVRILRISLIRVSALWLHQIGGEDQFIPLAPLFHDLDPSNFVEDTNKIARAVILA